MGTSSSYNGPTGKNSLLPPWAPDIPVPSDEDQDSSDLGEENNGNNLNPDGLLPEPVLINLPTVSWGGVKGIVSRMANNRSNASWNSAFKSYSRARGGSQTATRSSVSGRATTARLGSFLADAARRGITQAVKDIGLSDFVGRDAQSLLAAFIDLLAPPGALLEEAIARKALIETLAELFKLYDVETGGLTALDSIDAKGIKGIIILSITNYINERFEHELINCIERGTVSESDANKLLEQAKDFIFGVVEIDIEDIDVVEFDWDGSEGKILVENLYQTAYSLLGEQK